MTASISGVIEKYGRKLSIKPKEYEIGKPLKHTGRLVPIYPEKRGLSSKTIREKIYYILDNVIASTSMSLRAERSNLSVNSAKRSQKEIASSSLTPRDDNLIQETLPKEIISFNNLIPENAAYNKIHFPGSKEDIAKSRERLAFDELFKIQLSSYLIKQQWQKEKVGSIFQIQKVKSKIQKFVMNLPFKLTSAQKRVWEEIIIDLSKKNPMNRLLQGEVGSGKTVIAALACYLSYLNSYKSLLMAPTEILANQHHRTLIELFKNTKVKIGLQTSSRKNSKLKLSDFDIIVGTHSVIAKKFEIEKVGLVIIDEQHRFGVKQREEIKNKGINPHILTMTATPIPRTVALTLYGELDISLLDEMPIGRLPIKTFFVPKQKRASGYEWIKSQILNHKAQIFIVCPLIEESEVETMKSIKAAKKEYDSLLKIFSGFKLSLLHGKMKTQEKDKVMDDFKNKKIDILVTTPVVEVGVDIPSATVMLIEGAERFGLAQLHQLRGRVGRGTKQSYCFLFSETESQNVVNRLVFFSRTLNGNELAEKDLKIRGPGDLYGTKQHGFIDLKIASLSDYKMIEKTKNAVKYFVKHFSTEDFDLSKIAKN